MQTSQNAWSHTLSLFVIVILLSKTGTTLTVSRKGPFHLYISYVASWEAFERRRLRGVSARVDNHTRLVTEDVSNTAPHYILFARRPLDILLQVGVVACAQHTLP